MNNTLIDANEQTSYETLNSKSEISMYDAAENPDIFEGFRPYEDDVDFSHLMEKHNVFCKFLINEEGKTAMYTDGCDEDVANFLSELAPLLGEHEKNKHLP